MHPLIWGKSFWTFLIFTVNSYYYGKTKLSYDEIHNVRRFFMSVGNVLPCKFACKPNFYKNIKIIPIDNFLESKEDMMIWLYKIYSLTLYENNRQLISYDEFINKNTKNVMNAVEFTFYNIISDYPDNPSMDDILQYKNFFNYFHELNILHNFYNFYKYHPIDKYFANSKTLMTWINIYYPNIYKYNSIEKFTSNDNIVLGSAVAVGIIITLAFLLKNN